MPVTIRLAPDVVTHFKSQGKGWQTRINQVLQEYVESRL
ncbi:MAG: BrnA antitoxin family protein [Deltaproteobacteria bacterium]|nr:BrnA antitoxin family protein [Deltaproteobacteria bacterium]MBT4639005.1 BrnA antitoxin family protein [Deltaproteobacteria bacterium]MBT6501492.1 BrnA antitoxin family protein [Deltaproteobacteria bacterium]MBT7153373.1 BrnA antitoxin family protein [Deltaproteobacteria bacterium]MBT7715742.1 BrnA antitoxin family protein [Deltaproteobacteria bacterium]